MKRFFVAKNFIQTLRFIYYMAKALGLISFTANFETSTIRRSFKDMLIFVAYMFVNCFLVMKAGFTSERENQLFYDSSLIQFIFNMFLALQQFALLGIPIVNYINAYKYHNLMLCITEVDGELQKLGYKHDYSAEYLFSTVYLAGSLACQIGCLVGTLFTNPYLGNVETANDLVRLLAFIMGNLVFITSCCYCCASLWALVYRYHKINCTFSLYFHTELGSKKLLLPLCEQHTIKTIAILYLKIGTGVQMCNNCFFIHIFYILASAFGLNLVCFFTIIHVILLKNIDNKITDSITLSQLFLSIFYLIVILQVIFAGSLLHKKAQQTALILHKATIYNVSKSRIIKQLRSFSVQLSHQTPKASCYFFDIDWKFLLTMISSFATYLNILVQFDIIQLRVSFSNKNLSIDYFK
ncbi:uncharacterized protein LOC128721310 [Anopheles nili]|uniref:uncharacterized protein LOC128721310 n=1 Tax=Anopheles nili TaxID=185578 RepID=UPI00237A6385|nr:uncharacterized protein LOC128721310 [Anopheles nili]